MKRQRNKGKLMMALLLIGGALATATPALAQRGFRGDRGQRNTTPRTEHRVQPTRGHRGHGHEGNKHQGHGHRGHGHQPAYRVVYETVGGFYETRYKRVWQAGHYDIVKRKVLIPGRFENRVTYKRHHGHIDKVIHQVWVPARYEIQKQRVWHAGEYVRKAYKVWIPKRVVARKVPIRGGRR